MFLKDRRRGTGKDSKQWPIASVAETEKTPIEKPNPI